MKVVRGDCDLLDGDFSVVKEKAGAPRSASREVGPVSTKSVDAVIVGAGACGSLVARKLVAHGYSVVVLEASRRFEPAHDFPNTVANAAKIMWTEPR